MESVLRVLHVTGRNSRKRRSGPLPRFRSVLGSALGELVINFPSRSLVSPHSGYKAAAYSLVHELHLHCSWWSISDPSSGNPPVQPTGTTYHKRKGNSARSPNAVFTTSLRDEGELALGRESLERYVSLGLSGSAGARTYASDSVSSAKPKAKSSPARHTCTPSSSWFQWYRMFPSVRHPS